MTELQADQPVGQKAFRNDLAEIERGVRHRVICTLRSRRAGLKAALQPLLDDQMQMLAVELGLDPWVRDRVMQGQAAALNVLSDRYDALDEAVHRSDIPFVELDSEGRIVYANDAFGELVEGRDGMFFPGLFGARAEHVRAALAAGRNMSLRVDLESGGAPLQVRLEVGPLRDEDGRSGNYALLLDQSAERSRLNAFKDGVLRTDPGGLIQFANERAVEVLGYPGSVLTTMSLFDVFVADDGDSRPLSHWLGTNVGFSELTSLRKLDGTLLPARVSGTPYVEGSNSAAGLLLLFAPLAEDLARQQLKSILIEHTDPKQIMDAALLTVREVIPFDLAAFGIYDDKCEHWKALSIVPKPEWEWSTRWFSVDEGIKTWLEKGKTWDNDVESLVAKLNPTEKNNPVHKAVLKDKLTHMLVLPIRQAGGYRSALSLLSRNRNYTGSDLRTLQNLGLEEVLQAADVALERQRASALRALKDELNQAPTTRALAERLAKGTAKCFDWDYVGVFRVDRANERFVLFAEHANEPGLLAQPVGRKTDYYQDLHAGMLGHCLERRTLLMVPDVTDTAANYDFVKTAPNQRSGMTVPLFVNGEIEMILDLESAEFNAFRGPDMEAARGLASDCEQIFAARWHQVIERAVMNRIEQAAVIVDSTGTIKDMNVAAEAIFGPSARGKKLVEFGAHDADRAALKHIGIEHRVQLRLSVAAGSGLPAVEAATVADQTPLWDDYGHQLWLFTRLSGQSRESDWRYLEETVTAVARQTRAPLLMADGLLRGAASLLREPQLMSHCANLLDQAANHLLKADLTFERLSDRLTMQQAPRDAPTQFDAIAMLYSEIEALPEDDRTVIDAPDEHKIKAPTIVKGWPDRLSFAFRSALSSLLLLRVTANDRLALRISEQLAGWLVVSMTLSSAGREMDGTQAADPIERSQVRARQMASIAVEAIEAAVQQHGGTLVQHGDRGFEISLPLSPLSLDAEESDL